jgi:transcriptional regulator with XRE-family HTH domain
MEPTKLEREYMDIGARLKEARKSKGWTQEYVESITGFKKSNISNWETGKARIDVEKLFDLCRIYGVKPNWIYEWNESANQTGSLSPSEVRLINSYRKLDEEGKAMIHTNVRAALALCNQKTEAENARDSDIAAA